MWSVEVGVCVTDWVPTRVRRQTMVISCYQQDPIYCNLLTGISSTSTSWLTRFKHWKLSSLAGFPEECRHFTPASCTRNVFFPSLPVVQARSVAISLILCTNDNWTRLFAASRVSAPKCGGKLQNNILYTPCHYTLLLTDTEAFLPVRDILSSYDPAQLRGIFFC